jgi:ubiquinone/menaquinone biosynthesis C-methylase UbiE
MSVSSLLTQKMKHTFTDSYVVVNKIIKYHLGNSNKTLKVLDIGCGEGEIIKEYLKDIPNCQIYGLDCYDQIKNKKIIYSKVDLESDDYPFPANFFDIIMAGQVIEHILNKDRLIANCHRLLKKGGIFVCATENIASFDNIISLMLGQEPLSQHTGAKYNSQSILSPNFMMKIKDKTGNRYHHKNVCSYYGLQRLFKINGFTHPQIKSLGNISLIFEKLFPIYNRLIIVSGVK